MALPSGTRLGPYEILGPLGAGGMGEVYKARDTRLDRPVAIKVLSGELAGNAQFRERFEREARAVSSLNHPHICVLHDIGRQDDADFLVMELLEGESLASRLQKGPLPVDQVLRYGIEIAEALDAAHRKGVLHRDLKPANIFLTRSGVKLLDFGLAKVREPQQEAMLTRTLTKGLTQEGTLLGTPQYMAPELLEGAEADARSDLFAFGAVLYEMLTAKRAFEGKTAASVMAAILHVDPPSVSTLQPVTPPALERVVKTCLDKNPDDRWQTARDLLRELRRISEPGPAPVVPATLKPRRNVALYAAVLGFALAAGLAFVHFRETAPEQRVLRYTVAAPDKTSFQFFALSPDGRYVAVVTTGERGTQLWVRALDALQFQALAGTEGAAYPFWSPDSRYIGFFAQGKMKKIAVNGGPPQTLCDAPNGRGGTWNREGVIVFAPNNSGGLSRVSAAGGVPVPVTKLEGNGVHRFPVFLPDGRRFLYLSSLGSAGQRGIHLAALDSADDRRLLADESSVLYQAPLAGRREAHLLFVRERTLMAQPVDPGTLQPSGDLFPVAEQMSRGPVQNYWYFSVSENATLLFFTGGRNISDRQYVWIDRSGKQLGTLGGSGSNFDFALSPDDKRVLSVRTDPNSGVTGDLWMHDLEHGTDSRFTFHPSVNRFAVWSPDGSRVIFSSNRSGHSDLYEKDSNGAGQEEVLFQSSQDKYTYDWSRDGRFIIFTTLADPKTSDDVWALPLFGDKKPIPLLRSQFPERMGQLSPDGRWLAYVSEETGRAEVYVQPFTLGDPSTSRPAGKWQISAAGGSDPRWRRDGKELFYDSADGNIMVSQINVTGASFERSTPAALFDHRLNLSTTGVYVFHYQPTADGKRFLLLTDPGEANGPVPLTAVTNWLAAVKK